MQHVGQSLDVHQAMLNRYVEQSVHLDAVQLNRVLFECSVVELLVQFSPDSGHVTPHLTQRGPVGWQIARQPATNRINAKSKQPVQCRMKTINAEPVLAQQVTVECLQVSHVEDDAMTLRNRPFIEGFGANQAE